MQTDSSTSAYRFLDYPKWAAWMKGLACLFILTMCAGCGSGTSGMDELRTLCEKDAGLTINRTVEVDGFYDATGSSINLIESDYQFIEYCDEHPLFTQAIPEPGCWRMRKVKRESGQCYERLDKRISKFVVDPYPEFLKDHCIAVEKIERPEAQYSYHSDFKQWLYKNDVSEFTRSDIYIKDTVSSEILGRYISYSFNERPRHTTARGCEIFEGNYPSYVEANLINTVLTPISKRSLP